jgi:hypothetical protein
MQKKSVPSNSYTESALMKLSKTLNAFRHSSNRLWEIVQRQRQSSSTISDDLTDASSPEPSLNNWDNHIETMAGTLQQCSSLVPFNLALVKKLVTKTRLCDWNLVLTIPFLATGLHH